MSKNNDKQKLMQKTAKEYKKGLKRVWICVLCLIPIILILTYFMAELGLPSWLSILINVVLGGFVCLFVYIIYDKKDERKKAKELLEMDSYDPFKD